MIIMLITTMVTISTESNVSTTNTMSPQSLFGLLRLSSSVLPVGAFSYSEGLESAVDEHWVHDEQSAQAWICDSLELGMVRCDWPFVDRLMKAWMQHDLHEVAHLNQLHLSTRETREIRMQSLQMGHAMLNWLDNHPIVHADLRAGLDRSCTSWIVAFTLAHHEFATPVSLVRLSHAFSWLENQVQAAMKSVPLGQQSGQRIIHAVSQFLIEKNQHYELHSPSPEPISFSPGLAILSSRHEHQYSRIFRS